MTTSADANHSNISKGTYSARLVISAMSRCSRYSLAWKLKPITPPFTQESINDWSIPIKVWIPPRDMISVAAKQIMITMTLIRLMTLTISNCPVLFEKPEKTYLKEKSSPLSAKLQPSIKPPITGRSN